MYDNMQLDKNVKISVFLLNSNKNIASDLMKKVITFFSTYKARTRDLI